MCVCNLCFVLYCSALRLTLHAALRILAQRPRFAALVVGRLPSFSESQVQSRPSGNIYLGMPFGGHIPRASNL
jgi:hypothetical protein